MNAEEVVEVVREARAAGIIPDLSGVDLADANLYGADLADANLYGADLACADLTRANLTRANLTSAHLTCADLTRANLTRAHLTSANLTRVRGGILAIDGLHPYRCLHIPTPDGWVTRIGCWNGTISRLRALIARDEGWPEAEGDEIARRRPLLEAFCAMAEAHESAHPDLIADLADYWKDEER